MEGDDLYSVGSSVPDRPPAAPSAAAAGDRSIAIAPASGSPGLGAVTAVLPAPAKLPGVIGPNAGAPDRAAAPIVVQEKVASSDDPNEATRQTVQKMCEYIRTGAADDLVKWWAECGVSRYGLGNREPRAMCWAMFWLVKHAVLFARDEPRLFQVGESGALDMLIAPSVLVRMTQPKEDCDGFTMLICALLAVVGVRTCIVTVAADPADPSRWSHVFPIALLETGSNCPLDCSHGAFPGWMVPREHIFRWQAWDLEGNPIHVAIPAKGAGLHGYVRPGRRMRRVGMGQVCCGYDDDGDCISCDTASVPLGTSEGDITGILPTPPVSGGGCIDQSSGASVACGSYAAGSIIPSAPAATSTVSFPASSSTSPSQIGTVISNAIASAAKVAQLAVLPAGSYITTNPTTGAQTIVTGGSSAASLLSASSLSGLLPIAAIGLVLLLVVSSMGKK